MSSRRASDLFVECLEAEGTKHVFGIPGEETLDLNESLADSSVAFVPRSHPEPACWPHDPEKRLETLRFRLVWSDIRDHLLRSAEVAEREPAVYQKMAIAARRRMRAYADRDQVATALRLALRSLDEDEAPLAESA